MLWKMKWSLLSLVVAARCLVALSYTVPPGSPGFYHGNSTSAVTFDGHSLFLDNKRLFVFSGEVHAWRNPSGKAAWRDVFQKMKVSLLREYTNACADSLLGLDRLPDGMPHLFITTGGSPSQNKELSTLTSTGPTRMFTKWPKKSEFS